MFYLAWQILLWLIIALLFGFFLGWLFWGRSLHRLKTALAKCETDLELYKKELEEACREEIIPELPSSIPTASPEEADDLKEILGVGPFLEKKLNAFGIYTFKQVAALKPDVIKQLGATFGSFSDRIVRERWVEQAKELYEKKYGKKL